MEDDGQEGNIAKCSHICLTEKKQKLQWEKDLLWLISGDCSKLKSSIYLLRHVAQCGSPSKPFSNSPAHRGRPCVRLFSCNIEQNTSNKCLFLKNIETPPYYKQKQSKLCNMTPDFTTVGLPSRGDTNLYFLPQRKFALHTPLSSDEKKKWGFGVTVGKLPIKRWQRLKTVFPR